MMSGQPPVQPDPSPHSPDRPDTQDRQHHPDQPHTQQLDTQRLDELVERLQRAAEQLRSGELSADAAATLVEDCAALATQASNELERLARAEVSPAAPGQESLL